MKRSTLCKSQCAGGGLWDVLRTSRSVRSGHRRPQPCRSKSATRRAALRAGSRLCTWTHSASTLRPLSPYGPDKRGLPSFPRMSALRCCTSSVRRGILCCGIGGQGARQPSLRSGRLWRPARAEQDNSRRHTPCPKCLLLVSKAGGSLLVVHAYLVCVRLLGWTALPSTSQQTLSVADGKDVKTGHRFAYPARA